MKRRMYGDVEACLTGVVIALVLCVFVPAALAVHVSVVPSSQTVSSGENFGVDIYIDPEGSAIGGVDYILCFNNTLLNGTLVTTGTFFDGFDTMVYGGGINNTRGEVDYGECIWSTGAGVTTPGTLTTITFQAIAVYGIDELYFNTVTVSDPGGNKISNVTVSNGSVRMGCGDVDGNGKVRMGDYFLLIDYIRKVPGREIENKWTADVDCSGNIRMGDYFLLIDYIRKVPGRDLECCCGI